MLIGWAVTTIQIVSCTSGDDDVPFINTWNTGIDLSDEKEGEKAFLWSYKLFVKRLLHFLLFEGDKLQSGLKSSPASSDARVDRCENFFFSFSAKGQKSLRRTTPWNRRINLLLFGRKSDTLPAAAGSQRSAPGSTGRWPAGWRTRSDPAGRSMRTSSGS